MRIAESDDSVSPDERHRGVRPFTQTEDRLHRPEDVFRSEVPGTLILERNGEDIEEHFGIRIRIEVTVVLFEESLSKFPCIREIAVMRECNTKGSGNEERLSFKF